MNLRYVAFFVFGLSFLVVLIESAFCQELNYLKKLSQDETAWERIQKLHALPPKIYMNVQCYHYEAYKTSGVNMEPITHFERVVTFTESEEFLYGSWVDVSERDTLSACTAAVARVKIDPGVLFGGQETFDDYKRLATEMIERNRHQDRNTDFALWIEIPGVEEEILGFVDLRVRPFWMRPLFFWIATLLWMTWPYRWLFRAKTGTMHCTLKKKIYKSATLPIGVEILHSAIVDLLVVDGSWTVNLGDRGRCAIPLSETSYPALAPYLPADGPSIPSYAAGIQDAASPLSYGPNGAVPVMGTNDPALNTAKYPQLTPINAAGIGYRNADPYQAEPGSDFSLPSYSETVGYSPTVSD